ncbi:hypothetical protein SODALDRAFT_348897 [Sodiomyces alkalinus F11]|uniref:Myb-like domain-containing protein n=1 Tax=Sodiomyces alkalinus (strain CBS 110278 / VKM F-3762 / F11) TaxID=1314773 RepID=A0A3N2Q1Y4_SODAK|nr:hypothetical protein SODALDRAFT_348897 [Sodiomyces alkalinus F11]ROT40716.1 hypothetical protein SODALDRAFT_348897 [Sodiomyces alkalinus F11]
MSDVQSDAGDTKMSGESGKPAAWTPAEKNQLVLRILNQALGEGSVDWKQIILPGRTTKALKNQWTRIHAEMKALALDGGDESGDKPVALSPAKPKKTATPRKRTPKKAPATGDAEAGENAGEKVEGAEGPNGETSTPTKPKRGRKRQADAVSDEEGSAKKKRTPKKPAKTKAKAKDSEEELEDPIAVSNVGIKEEAEVKADTNDKGVAADGETTKSNADSSKPANGTVTEEEEDA